MQSEVARGKLGQTVDKLLRLVRAAGPGVKLPPLRSLAATCRVSIGTTIRAIEVLENQGIMERRHGSGIYVRETFGKKRILIVCDSLMMIDPSPVWGMIVEQLLKPYQDRPDEVTFLFTAPQSQVESVDELANYLPESTWSELRSGAYSAALLIGTKSSLCWELERLGVRTVGFGCAAKFIIQMSDLNVCQLGIQELVRLGCARIAVLGVELPAAYDVASSVLGSYGLSLYRTQSDGQSKLTVLPSRLRNQIVRGGFEAAMSFFDSSTDAEGSPDGIVILDDMFTQGFLFGMRKLDLQPRQDIQIATHANRGSPVLIGLDSEVVKIEYDIQYLVEALLYGVNCLARGSALTEFGWAKVIVQGEGEWEVETQTLQPALIPYATASHQVC